MKAHYSKAEKSSYVWHILQGKKKDISDNYITIITLVLIWELLRPLNRLRVEGNALISIAKREDRVTARKAGLSRQAAASLPALPATVLKKTALNFAGRGANAEQTLEGRPGARGQNTAGLVPSLPAPRPLQRAANPPRSPRGSKAGSGAVDRPAALKVPPASCSLSVRVCWGGEARGVSHPRCSTQVAAAGLPAPSLLPSG